MILKRWASSQQCPVLSLNICSRIMVERASVSLSFHSLRREYSLQQQCTRLLSPTCSLKRTRVPGRGEPECGSVRANCPLRAVLSVQESEGVVSMSLAVELKIRFRQTVWAARGKRQCCTQSAVQPAHLYNKARVTMIVRCPVSSAVQRRHISREPYIGSEPILV